MISKPELVVGCGDCGDMFYEFGDGRVPDTGDPCPTCGSEKLGRWQESSGRGKWAFDGCGTIDDLVNRCNEIQEALLELEGAGFELVDNGDDYLMFHKPV